MLSEVAAMLAIVFSGRSSQPETCLLRWSLGLVTVLSCVLIPAGALWAQDTKDRPLEMAANEEKPPADCGVTALYTLIQLLGRSATIETIIDQMDRPSKEGRSMLDLKHAASEHGIDLKGTHLDISHLDGPAISFINGNEHGHFVVVRPVGHTGSLFQVYDTLNDPIIIDQKELMDRSGWTGVALVHENGIPDRNRLSSGNTKHTSFKIFEISALRPRFL